MTAKSYRGALYELKDRSRQTSAAVIKRRVLIERGISAERRRRAYRFTFKTVTGRMPSPRNCTFSFSFSDSRSMSGFVSE